MATRHWVQLALTKGIGPILTARIIEVAGSAQLACDAGPMLLREIAGIGAAKATQVFQALRDAGKEVDAELDRAAAAGVTLLCLEDAKYPVVLRSIPDPPPVLYVRGALEDRDLNAVAIVGSRRCSYYGREQSERFAALLAGAGVTIVSGGARGVDSAAHQGALSHPQGRTVAVLGCGVDVAYPPENDRLFGRIAERGAVISEYPMATPPLSENFPRRNRIVSGLARGVLVVEADDRSGALITARLACDDHGRPVFAIPGRVDNALSAGPHKLIRDGATLVARVEDILDGLGPLPQQAMEPTLFSSEAAPAPREDAEAARPATVSLSERQEAMVAAMGADPVSVDWLIEHTGLAAPVVLQELTFLTLKGVVYRVDGQTYARRR
jgi:DNA processing protein